MAGEVSHGFRGLQHSHPISQLRRVHALTSMFYVTSKMYVSIKSYCDVDTSQYLALYRYVIGLSLIQAPPNIYSPLNRARLLSILLVKC